MAATTLKEYILSTWKHPKNIQTCVRVEFLKGAFIVLKEYLDKVVISAIYENLRNFKILKK